jgi:hypothetical protein
METIHKSIGKTLNWIQSGSSKREFELRGEPGVFGSLKWQKRFGSLAAAITADDQWTFKREGFLHPRVSVRKTGSDQNLAIFKPGWTGSGILEFDNGLKLEWKNKNFLRSEWTFTDQNKEDILHFQSRPRILKINIQMGILKDLPEIPLLACLGLYLLFLMHEESAASSAAVVPVMASGS